MSILTFKKEDIEYALRISKKAERLRITIGRDGSVIVTVPGNANTKTIDEFLTEKIDWIKKTLESFKPFKKIIKTKRKNTKIEFKKNKGRALKLLKERAEYFNRTYTFKYKKITVRNQKTRWGSCSRNGNINFNYKIINLEPSLQDYIVVHELCHLGEFNHSKKFWALVEKTIPNYKDLRKKLKNVD